MSGKENRPDLERKRAEEAQHQLEEQLHHSQKLAEVGKLAGVLTHEFNNLLTAIMGGSELLMGCLPPGGPLLEEAQQINEAARRAADLTRRLLTFSHKQVLQTRVLDLNAVVVDMEKLLRHLIGEDIELLTTLGLALGRVKADQSQIEQVIMNMAVNARDAMPGGGTLTIETSNVELDEMYGSAHLELEPGAYVMLAISDTGCGMNARTRTCIFEPFFTTKKEGEGTGLGLSTVYGTVKQVGGSIHVYSEPERGTAFKVFLPRIDETVEPNGSMNTHIMPPRGSETILLVEDDGLVRKQACRMLREKGYTVLEAHNGQEALLLSQRHQGIIHLMVTDIVMPQMSGRELFQRLVALRPETKVLYMSGYTERVVSRIGELDLNTTFLEKPFTMRTLTCKVRDVLAAS